MSVGSGILMLGCAYGYLYFQAVWETGKEKFHVLKEFGETPGKESTQAFQIAHFLLNSYFKF